MVNNIYLVGKGREGDNFLIRHLERSFILNGIRINERIIYKMRLYESKRRNEGVIHIIVKNYQRMTKFYDLLSRFEVL